VTCVVLQVAQGGVGVEGEGDRRVPQRVRRQVLPCSTSAAWARRRTSSHRCPCRSRPPDAVAPKARSVQPRSFARLERHGQPGRGSSAATVAGASGTLAVRAPLRVTRNTRCPASAPRSDTSGAHISSTRSAAGITPRRSTAASATSLSTPPAWSRTWSSPPRPSRTVGAPGRCCGTPTAPAGASAWSRPMPDTPAR
jgi:hypothetical protein